VSVRTKGSSNCAVEVRKNDGVTVVTSINLVNEVSKTVDNLNINLDVNDFIQSYLIVDSGSVGYPIVSVELAYR
jgi:hypothetical protein